MAKNRVLVWGVALIALVGLFFFLQSRQNASTDAANAAGTNTETSVRGFPKLDKEQITEVTIQRPEDNVAVTLRRSGPSEKGEEREKSQWRVVAPVQAASDASAVNNLLDKLGEMATEGVASTNSENHARLEVDDAQAIHVTVKAGDNTTADVYIGKYSGDHTMVRLAGADDVYRIAGSLRYAFNKDLAQWRDRRIVDIDSARVVGVRFEGEKGTFAFNKSDDWEVTEGGPIERFDATRVQSGVTSFARLSATEFAAADATLETTGLATPSGRVVLTVGPEEKEEEPAAQNADAGANAETDAGTSTENTEDTEVAAAITETIVLLVGKTEGSNVYLKREGVDTVYLVPSYAADRLRPDMEAFQSPEPEEDGPDGSEPALPQGALPGGGMPGMPGMGGGGSGMTLDQLPPEVRRQIQQQMQQQQGAP